MIRFQPTDPEVADREREINARPGRRWVTLAWALGYLLLAAWLLFAHGCHSDADTELSTFISESASAAAGH